MHFAKQGDPHDAGAKEIIRGGNMGLESLFLFTLLGGLAAGAYVFEVCFQRTRKSERPWLVPLVVVVLFAIGMIAAATHVHSLSRAFASIGAGAVNFGSGMVKEVLLAGIFFVLALIDLIITFVKKDSPFVLRVIGAIAAVLVIVLMGAAYIDVYGNAVWSNAPATILTFVAGALAMGLGLCAALGSADIAEKPVVYTLVAVDVVLAIGLALEVAAFSGAGLNPAMQIAGLVIAPIASAILVLAGSKFKNKTVLAIVVCAVLVIGVAIARYGFYATCAM